MNYIMPFISPPIEAGDFWQKELKQSMKAMDPLFGLSKDEKKQFLRWITQSDRKYLMKANKYYHSLVDRFIK